MVMFIIILGEDVGGRVLFCSSRLALNLVFSSSWPRTFDSPFSDSLVLGLQTRCEVMHLANEFHILLERAEYRSM